MMYLGMHVVVINVFVLSQISKSHAERLCDSNGILNLPVIQYVLKPDQYPEPYIPKITVNVTGADRKLSFDLTLKSAGIFI